MANKTVTGFDVEDLKIDLPTFDVGGFDNEEGLDLALFDTEGNDDNTFTRYIRPQIYNVPTYSVRYDNARQLAESMKWTGKLPRYDAFVSGNFVFADFIEAFLRHNECKATHMTIATLSMNYDNVDMLRDLMEDGYIDDLLIVISAYFWGYERWKLMPYLYEKLDIDDRLQVAVAGIHTKTCNFVTLGGKKICMHGSANLRSSSNIELFTIEENAKLYDFYEETYGILADKYKTINKPVRSKTAWDGMEKH